MKLTFYGAARAVTGSCHCITCNGRKILIDCGLQQGKDEWDNSNSELEFVPSLIDDVIVTHAHIDHTGRLPLLVKQGFRGRIFCTRVTGELLDIMLRDSAHIQESDASWKNQKGRRSGAAPVEPLYTLQDVMETLELIVPCEYGREVRIDDQIHARFTDAGHLLGSAAIELWLTENGSSRKVVFTGDLGNTDQPIIRDPQPIYDADYLVTESTYGNREHEDREDYTARLAQIIDETLGNGGNVVIPSFAVGRTQELLYKIREMKEQNMVKSVPHFEVVVDSPLANEATRIYSGDLRGYLDEEALATIRERDLFTFPGLRLIPGVEESRALNTDPTPRVIISAAGMCDAGRVRHHLKHNLWRQECTVVFVGYQAEGTLGRSLLDGVKRVKLFGEEIEVNANIYVLHGLSSHADRSHLLAWAQNFDPAPRHTFVVHGQDEVTEEYAQLLTDNHIPAHAPLPGEVYDLLENRVVEAGTARIRPTATVKAKPMQPASPAYRRLEQMAKELLLAVEHNRGGSNKDLGKFADQIRALIEKWDR